RRARRGRVSGQQHGEPQHHRASGGNFESPAASTVAATTSISDTTDATIGEPHGQPERGRRWQASPTPRASWCRGVGQVLVTITGGSIITIASGGTERHGERRQPERGRVS
ncbi:MAG: hypothetical protein IPN05_20040, partial [Sulfuritalea sp.]|nr:hypothetical protein [Sulfuritalea sp.]